MPDFRGGEIAVPDLYSLPGLPSLTRKRRITSVGSTDVILLLRIKLGSPEVGLLYDPPSAECSPTFLFKVRIDPFGNLLPE